MIIQKLFRSINSKRVFFSFKYSQYSFNQLNKVELKFSSKSFLNYFNEYDFSTYKKNIPNKPTLDQYQAIKQRQSIADEVNRKQMIEKYQDQGLNTQKLSNSSSPSHTSVRCNGCNVFLQSHSKTKYGFIKQDIFKQAIASNQNLIKQTYGEKIKEALANKSLKMSSDSNNKIIEFLYEIEKETGMDIFNKKMQNKDSKIKHEDIIKSIDNINILLKLQQKIDAHEQENQTLKRSKKVRKQLYCYRCHSLKYHNHLPQEYDHEIYEGGLNIDRQFVLEKVFNKHKAHQDITHYLFIVDALDLLATFRKDLLFKLLENGIKFSMIINKYDIINEKYLTSSLLHAEVNKILKDYLEEYRKQLQQKTPYHNFRSEQKLKQIKTFFVSSVSRQGIKKIEEFMNLGIKRIQLFGLPNTGKTTLLNKLLRSQKITSKIPGTTIRITEHVYRNKIKIFDMPGLHYPNLMYNLIAKPSLKSLLTWSKHYSPPLITHQCYIYGGKIQANGLRIIPFGLGGCCTADNRWFLLNYKQFWKGLPNLDKLNMKKYEETLTFVNGHAQDLQIAGYGFIGFKSCIKTQKNFTTKITFYLPQKIEYNLRDSVLKSDEGAFHNRSGLTKKHQLQRIQHNSLAFNRSN